MAIHSESASTSRRALLAGALGGIGALAASAIGQTSPVRANDPNDVVLGSTNTSGSNTTIQNTANDNSVFAATSQAGGTAVIAGSNSGYGVFAYSTSSYGVVGQSNTGYAVRGWSQQSVGVQGYSNATSAPAIIGTSTGDFTGVMGYSGAAAPPAARAKTGVYGYAKQDTGAKGVWGETTTGHAVHGTSSSSGYAGYFAGKVYTTKWYELAEIAVPAAASSNKARIFLRDNGSGKTQLCVIFHTGAIQILATQP